MKKTFAPFPKGPLREIVCGYGGCVASDLITVAGKKVGYMYREPPIDEADSGWRFLAGCETKEFMADTSSHGVYDVNTIANYDEEIVPFLDAPIGWGFERRANEGLFPVEAPPEITGEGKGGPNQASEPTTGLTPGRGSL